MEQEVDSFLDTYAPATKLSKHPGIQGGDGEDLILYDASLAANCTANRAAVVARAAACLLGEGGGVEAPSGKHSLLAANSDRLASRGMASDDPDDDLGFTIKNGRFALRRRKNSYDKSGNLVGSSAPSFQGGGGTLRTPPP